MLQPGSRPGFTIGSTYPISQSYMSRTRFEDASQQLLRVVRERIRAGDASERGLAKLTGLSQPHVHNVLAGKRGLGLGVADRLMAILGTSLEELLPGQTLPERELPLPWLQGPIGGGRAFPRTTIGPPGQFFDRARAAQLQEPCLGRVAEEETAMRPTLEPGDDILLDCGRRVRRRPRNGAIYVIEWQGRSYLCHCHATAGALITLVESPTRTPPPARIGLSERGMEEIVRGEIVWYGRMLNAV